MAKSIPPPQKLIRFDWFIKKMLRDKADFEILEGFLSELLKEDVVIEEIIESESNKQERDDKFNRVDVLVKLETGERVIVEIQNTRELDYLQRIYYGTSKSLVETLHESNEYKNIKRIYSISVVYFKLGIGKDYVYVGETSFRGYHNPDDILGLSQDQLVFFATPKIKSVSDIFARYFIIRAREFDKEVEDALDEWIYFFKTATVRGNVPAKGLDKAQDRLRVSQLDGEELRKYNYYLELQHSDASYEAQFKFELEKAIKKKLNKAQKEVDKAQKEADKAKSELDKAKKEAEAEKEQLKQEAEAEKEQMILNLHKNGVGLELIALSISKTIEEIQQVISKNKK